MPNPTTAVRRTSLVLVGGLLVSSLTLSAALAQTQPILPTPPSPVEVVTATNPNVTAESQAVNVPATLAALKARAANEITTRLTLLATLNTKVGAAKSDCGTNAALATVITSTVAAETALQATIAADTDLTKARADYKQIFENYRVYALVAPKTSLTLSCDNLNAYATKLGAEAARLQSAIDAAKAKGGDVSVAQNAHDAALTQSSAFVAAAKTAVGSVMALTPDKGDKSLIASNKAAVNAAHAAMKAQHDAGRTAHETLKSGYAALPKRQPKTPNQAKTPKTPKTAASTTALAAVTTTAKP